MRFRLLPTLPVLFFLFSNLQMPAAVAQNCPCKAIKLGVDTTKGMKFDTVAYHAVKDSTQLLFDYATTKAYLLALWGLEQDSIGLSQANEVDQLTVKQYGTHTQLPYNYISYVNVSRKGSSLQKFNYKIVLVLKDSAYANDTVVFDTAHATSLAKIPTVLNSLLGTIAPVLTNLLKHGKSVGIDTIRGITFDQEAYKDSAGLVADYSQAKGIADTLLAFYKNVWVRQGLQVVPFGFVDGEVDLGNNVTGNGTRTFGLLKIKNNHCMLDTITMINTTSDTITVQGFDLGQSEFYSLDSIITFDTTMKSPLPASIPVGGSLMAVIKFCHDADTSPVATQPVVTVPLTISAANHHPQMYTLQGQAVLSSYDYISSVTLDRKGKTLNVFDYKLTILIKDAMTGDTVLLNTMHEANLAGIPQDLTTMVRSFSPTLNTLRNYQAKIRTDSADHYIALKYTILPERSTLKSNETTQLHVHVFDCDGTDVRGRHFDIGLNAGSESQLSESQITTDNQGLATVTFTAGPKPEVAKAKLDYSYITVTHHSATISDCGSKSIGVGAPYTLKVNATLHVQSNGGNTGDFQIKGEGPMMLQITADDTCGKWIFLDGGVTLTMTGTWVAPPKNNSPGATCTYSGSSYLVPATFQTTGCEDGASATLHLDQIGPSGESYQCCCPSISTPDGGGGSGGVNTIMLACFNATKMHNAQSEGQDKIAQLRALAARVQASQSSGRRDTAAYRDLMQSVSGGGLKLSAMSFDFKDQLHKESSNVFDYSPPADEVASPEAEKSATIHVTIEKNE